MEQRGTGSPASLANRRPASPSRNPTPVSEQRGGIELFLGSDRPRKLKHLQELASTLRISPLDRHDLDGAALRPAELVSLGRQHPSVSAVRLIVVDNAHRMSAEGVDALLQHAEVIKRTACVVLLVDRELSVRHPLIRAASREAMAVTRFTERETSPAKPFALIDALGARDVSGCLEAVRDQLMQGREPTEVIGLLAWQAQRWVAVRRLSDAGFTPQQIAAATGMRAWQVDRSRAHVSGRSLDSLRRSLKRCWQLEEGVKSGRILPWLAIEQFVVEWCVGVADGMPGARTRGGPVTSQRR